MLCTATQCMMRNPQLQYTCNPITREMTELHGAVGELHHALTGPCKALNVDVTLGPLDLAFSQFLRAVQTAYSGIGMGDSESNFAETRISKAKCPSRRRILQP